jgi:hypothetical protein
MAETREFVGLERIARRREQELPRWLGPRTGDITLIEILRRDDEEAHFEVLWRSPGSDTRDS